MRAAPSAPAVFPRRWFVVGSVVAAAATVLFLLWVQLRVGGPRTTDAFDDIGELVAAWAATALCALGARRAPVARVSWTLLALSSLVWGIGELMWCWYDLVEKVTVPFPSWADAGFLASVPLAFAALVKFPGSARRATYHLQRLLDGCIIATALLYASWATVLGPIYRAHRGGPFKQAVSLTYPMSDVVMLSLVVILLARTGGQGRMSLGLVMAGLVAFAVADSSFAYLTEVNSYGIGNALDTGWVAGYLLVGLGALWALTSPAPRTDSGEESAISVVAPYVPVLVVLVVTGVQLMRGRHIGSVSWGMAFVLVLLVLGRELVRLADQARVARLGGGGGDGAPPTGDARVAAVGR